MKVFVGGLFCLLLLSCCWLVAEALRTNPALKVRLSRSSLNFVSRIALKMLGKMKNIPLPSVRGKVGMFGSNVRYSLDNVKVSADLVYINWYYIAAFIYY